MINERQLKRRFHPRDCGGHGLFQVQSVTSNDVAFVGNCVFDGVYWQVSLDEWREYIMQNRRCCVQKVSAALSPHHYVPVSPSTPAF